MIKVCDTCRRRLVQFSFLSQRTTMPSINLLKVILLIALYSCNTLSIPVKSGVPEFGDWLKEKTKPKTPQPSIFGPRYEYSPFTPVGEVMSNQLAHQLPKPACANEVSKILFPLKYRFEDGLMDPADNRPNLVKLPMVKQPYENYKVLVATAPPGVELGEDSHKPMTVYIIFNDERTYPSPMNLPTVYFVRKRTMTHKSIKDVNPILVIDSNRTVTGLRSKEIQKFVKFTNKLTHRLDETQGGTNNNLVK